MDSFAGTASPTAARERWHTDAAQRDKEYLDQGPMDMTETGDSPWSSVFATQRRDGRQAAAEALRNAVNSRWPERDRRADDGFLSGHHAGEAQ